MAATGSPGVDVILKNHDPPESNAVRFLHRLQQSPALQAIPTISEWPPEGPPACRKMLTWAPWGRWRQGLGAAGVQSGPPDFARPGSDTLSMYLAWRGRALLGWQGCVNVPPASQAS